jgi:hypothetical protein
LSKPYRDYSADQKRRNDLWASLNRYVMERGDSWIVSAPGSLRVRIETKSGSDLAECLAKHQPKYCGTTERLTPNAVEEVIKREGENPRKIYHPGLLVCDILELELK